MKLVSSVPLDEGQRARLDTALPGIEIVTSDSFLNDEVGELVDADTGIVYAFRLPGDLLHRAPNLRWVQLLGAGCDHLFGTPLMRSDIPITTASGVHATPIAEYVLGVILGHYRWLPQSYRAQMHREWLSQMDVARGSRELRNRTIAIIGYGSIGREVARLAKPFGTRILAVKRDPAIKEERGYTIEGTGDPRGELPDAFYGFDRIHEVLSESDVVVLAVPMTPETDKMIGVAEFDAMRKGSYLVNIARGEVIDERALMNALANGPMAGAALDVFNEEPLPADSPLWGFENAVITPHISGASRPHLRRTFEILAENLERFAQNRPLLNRVDPVKGY